MAERRVEHKIEKELKKEKRSIKELIHSKIGALTFAFGKLVSSKHKSLPNSLKRTIGLSVYSLTGEVIGKVLECYLEDYRIYGWLIELDKPIAQLYGNRIVLIKQKHIVSIKNAMMVDELISNHLHEPSNLNTKE